MCVYIFHNRAQCIFIISTSLPSHSNSFYYPLSNSRPLALEVYRNLVHCLSMWGLQVRRPYSYWSHSESGWCPIHWTPQSFVLDTCRMVGLEFLPVGVLRKSHQTPFPPTKRGSPHPSPFPFGLGPFLPQVTPLTLTTRLWAVQSRQSLPTWPKCPRV